MERFPKPFKWARYSLFFEQKSPSWHLASSASAAGVRKNMYMCMCVARMPTLKKRQVPAHAHRLETPMRLSCLCIGRLHMKSWRGTTTLGTDQTATCTVSPHQGKVFASFVDHPFMKSCACANTNRTEASNNNKHCADNSVEQMLLIWLHGQAQE